MNPDDAGEQKDAEGKACVPAGYETQLSASQWATLPAYANLKFRAGSGSNDVLETGLIASLPLMRVEEMYFDYFEAIAHTQSVAAAAQALQNFVNTYRYTDDSYQCEATDMDSTRFLRQKNMPIALLSTWRWNVLTAREMLTWLS